MPRDVLTPADLLGLDGNVANCLIVNCPRKIAVCALRASGSGGPVGERNGQFRHGGRTAMAERRKFILLIRMLRDIPS